MLRAACFDLWETLIIDPPGRGEERAEGRVRRIARALRGGGWPAPYAAVTDALQATVDSLVTLHQDNRDGDADERVVLFYQHLDPTLRPEHDLPADARAEIREAIHGSALHLPPELLPGAAETLDELRRRGLRLALVSNTGLSPGSTMRQVVDDLGIGRNFTAQVYSDEVGAWKPDARMFDEAVFALGVAAKDVLFVGDTPEADIVGAQAFGMGMTALVGDKAIDGVRADLELPGVHALVAALSDRGLLRTPE
ncbi:MAG: HAD family hydrolase [Dehalococcoidia bacterium]